MYQNRMPYKVIFLLTFIMLISFQYQRSLNLKTFYKYQKKIKLERMLFSDKGANNVFNKMILGSKRVPNKYRELFKETGDLHLLTPSGLHITTLLGPLKFFAHKYLYRSFIILLFFLAPLIPGLFALKRIITYYFLSELSKTFKLNNSKTLFLITFAFDFIFGSFQQSQLSFIFSFLFWGVFITSKCKKSILFNLFASKYLINFFFIDTSFYLLSIASGLMLTGFFTLFFPLWVLSYLLNSTFFSMTNYSFNFFIETHHHFLEILKWTPVISINEFGLFAIFIILFSRKKS